MKNGHPKKPPSNVEPVESLGQTWLLSEVGPTIRKAFARMVRMRARQQLIDDKEALGDEEYAAEWERLQARIDAGAYDWGPPLELGGTGAGKAIRASLSTTEGNLELLCLLLAESHGEITLARADEIASSNPEGVTAAIRAALGLSPLAVPPSQQAPAALTETSLPPATENASVLSKQP